MKLIALMAHPWDDKINLLFQVINLLVNSAVGKSLLTFFLAFINLLLLQ